MGLPYDESTDPNSRTDAPSKRRWAFRYVALAALVVLALAVLTGARGGFGHGHHDPEEVRAHAAFAIERMLGKVDANDEQIEKIQAIADATLGDLFAFKAEHEDFHAEVIAALTAEEIDRDRLEAMRREKIVGFDAISQQLVAAVADIGDVLSPEQRQAIAERVARHH